MSEQTETVYDSNALGQVIKECYDAAESAIVAGNIGEQEQATNLDEAGLTSLRSLAKTIHACRGAAITLAIYKCAHFDQDIRLFKAESNGGFSARSVDNSVTVPFLKSKGLQYNVETHWLSQTLSFAENYCPETVLKTAPKNAGPDFIKVANYIESAENISNIKAMLVVILYKMIEQRNNGNIPLTHPKHLSIDQVMSLLHAHFSVPYHKNTPRLPQVAMYAIYQCLMKSVERYSEFELMPLERMKTANRKSGSVGDIDLAKDGRPVEAVEIKYEIPISLEIVTEAMQKIQTQSVERYFILSTKPIVEGDEKKIQEHKESFLKSNGCEIIVNGVYDTIKYYLRLLNTTGDFINTYTDLLAADVDLNYEHRVAWNIVCDKLLK